MHPDDYGAVNTVTVPAKHYKVKVPLAGAAWESELVICGCRDVKPGSQQAMILKMTFGAKYTEVKELTKKALFIRADAEKTARQLIWEATGSHDGIKFEYTFDLEQNPFEIEHGYLLAVQNIPTHQKYVITGAKPLTFLHSKPPYSEFHSHKPKPNANGDTFDAGSLYGSGLKPGDTIAIDTESLPPLEPKPGPPLASPKFFEASQVWAPYVPVQYTNALAGKPLKPGEINTFIGGKTYGKTMMMNSILQSTVADSVGMDPEALKAMKSSVPFIDFDSTSTDHWAKSGITPKVGAKPGMVTWAADYSALELQVAAELESMVGKPATAENLSLMHANLDNLQKLAVQMGIPKEFLGEASPVSTTMEMYAAQLKETEAQIDKALEASLLASGASFAEPKYGSGIAAVLTPELMKKQKQLQKAINFGVMYGQPYKPIANVHDEYWWDFPVNASYGADKCPKDVYEEMKKLAKTFSAPILTSVQKKGPNFQNILKKEKPDPQSLKDAVDMLNAAMPGWEKEWKKEALGDFTDEWASPPFPPSEATLKAGFGAQSVKVKGFKDGVLDLDVSMPVKPLDFISFSIDLPKGIDTEKFIKDVKAELKSVKAEKDKAAISSEAADAISYALSTNMLDLKKPKKG